MFFSEYSYSLSRSSGERLGFEESRSVQQNAGAVAGSIAYQTTSNFCVSGAYE